MNFIKIGIAVCFLGLGCAVILVFDTLNESEEGLGRVDLLNDLNIESLPDNVGSIEGGGMKGAILFAGCINLKLMGLMRSNI